MRIVDEVEIARMADALAEIATAPELLTALEGIQHGSPENALSEAKRIASLDYLRAQGIAPPKDFRITTRSFEPPELAPRVDTHRTGPVATFENGRLTVRCDGWVVSVGEVASPGGPET